MGLRSFFSLDQTEVGCDEAGRGCLAGAVYAAAVILPKEFEHPLLNDSKQLTESQRYTLREVIERDAIAYAVGICDEREIDEINILQASIRAMHKALDQIKPPFDLILVDGNRFRPYRDKAHQCVVKGDATYTAIAAASILAKTYRDDYMDALHAEFPHFDWKNNKGYPTQKHRAAIREFGASRYHRQTFKLLEDAPVQGELF